MIVVVDEGRINSSAIRSVPLNGEAWAEEKVALRLVSGLLQSPPSNHQLVNSYVFLLGVELGCFVLVPTGMRPLYTIPCNYHTTRRRPVYLRLVFLYCKLECNILFYYIQ